LLLLAEALRGSVHAGHLGVLVLHAHHGESLNPNRHLLLHHRHLPHLQAHRHGGGLAHGGVGASVGDGLEVLLRGDVHVLGVNEVAVVEQLREVFVLAELVNVLERVELLGVALGLLLLLLEGLVLEGELLQLLLEGVPELDEARELVFQVVVLVLQGLLLLELLLGLLLEVRDLLVLQLYLQRQLSRVVLQALHGLAQLLNLVVESLLRVEVALAGGLPLLLSHGLHLLHVDLQLEISALLLPEVELAA